MPSAQVEPGEILYVTIAEYALDMARRRPRFSTEQLIGGHVVAIAPDRIFVETARERAARTYTNTILHSLGHLIWISICGIVAAAVVAAVTASSTDALVLGALTLAGGLVGLGFGLGSSYVKIWALSPRDQRDELRMELFELRGRHDALLAEIHRPPQIVADMRMESSPNDGRPLLRLDIKNDGSQPLPAGELLSVIYPASWTTFEGCTSEGLYVIGGPSIVSDEDLPGGVPARLWVLELGRALAGHGRTHLFYFRVHGPPGPHQFYVRIEKLNKLFSLELAEVA